MAPVTTSAIGVSRQVVDDPKLERLMNVLSEFKPKKPTSETFIADNDVDTEALVAHLSTVQKWRFQELADLFNWIDPLDAIDAALTKILQCHPGLLLIGGAESGAYYYSYPSSSSSSTSTSSSAKTHFLPGSQPDSSPSPSEEQNAPHPPPRGASSAVEAVCVPAEIIEQVSIILTFLLELLRHSFNKIVFNSLEQIAALLAASDDTLSSKALRVLQSLVAPPLMHRQHTPDLTQHATVLHHSQRGGSMMGYHNHSSSGRGQQPQPSQIHDNVLEMARGWGSRDCGLGLYSCVTVKDEGGDDPNNVIAAANKLPNNAGEVIFDFLPKPLPKLSAATTKLCAEDSALAKKVKDHKTDKNVGGSSSTGSSTLHKKKKLKHDPSASSSSLPLSQPSSSSSALKVGGADDVSPSAAAASSPTSASAGSSTRSLEPVKINLKASDLVQHGSSPKSTAEIFFSILDQPVESFGNYTTTTTTGSGSLKVKDILPVEKYFTLLSHIRLARGFLSHELRLKAVEDRLVALTVALAVYPSVDVMGGYFFAQPELCAELGDLLRPTIASSTTSATSTSSPTTVSSGVGGNYLSVGAHSSIPHHIQLLALEVFTALVARRDSTHGSTTPSNGLSPVAKNANVLSELGVGKGQHLGLLPTLIRYSLAALNTSQPCTATTSPSAFYDLEVQSLEFIDAILTLTSAVIALPSATSSLTDSGFIPPLIGTIVSDRNFALASLNAATANTTTSTTKHNNAIDEESTVYLRKYITSQAVQILESAIVTHGNALTAFHDLHGTDIIISRIDLEVKATQLEGGGSNNEIPPSSNNNNDDHGEKKGASEDEDDSVPMEVDGGGATSTATDVSMEQATTTTGATATTTNDTQQRRPMRGTRRALFFSLLNCLTVVFHHQESNGGGGNNSSSRSTSSQLRRPELTGALMEFLDQISSYGPVLASLTVTMMSDVMNADPQVVHHVHESGLAHSFLNMIQAPKKAQTQATKTPTDGEDDEIEEWLEPTVPSMAELIMSIPNVLSALALTEDGANAVKEANPFPSFFSLFCSPRYAMPYSRCMLNDITAIVGTGMDELMRHVPSLRGMGMKALVGCIRRVRRTGEQLLERERREDDLLNMQRRPHEGTELENARTCFVQFAFHMSQLTEQMLQHVDHVKTFVDEGGLDALLDVFPMLVLANTRFLSYMSCLSNPYMANLSHVSTTNSMYLSIKAIAQHYHDSSTKFLPKLLKRLNEHLDKVQVMASNLLMEQQKAKLSCEATHQQDLGNDAMDDEKDSTMLDAGTTTQDEDQPMSGSPSNNYRLLDARGLLHGIPALPLHVCLEDGPKPKQSQQDCYRPVVFALSEYLRESANTSWLVMTLSTVLKSTSQRSGGLDSSSSDGEGWKRLLASEDFANTLERLTVLYSSSQLEAARVRTSSVYEEHERLRHEPPNPAVHDNGNFFPSRYRLRIVCQDGAVVRDGIEIDSCRNVGNLEMGEVIEAFDRCINVHGIMRYRTHKGWISEYTRGQCPEPIAEVVSIQGPCGSIVRSKDSIITKEKGLECGVPDLRSVGASVLSRTHVWQKHLLSTLSRIVSQTIRSSTGGPSAMSSSRPLSANHRDLAGSVILVIKNVLDRCFVVGFESCNAMEPTASAITSSSTTTTTIIGSSEKNDDGTSRTLTTTFNSGLSLYFGGIIELCHSCLFDEKRERRTLNLGILLALMQGEGFLSEIFRDSNENSIATGDDIPEQKPPIANLTAILPTKGLFGALRYVLQSTLEDARLSIHSPLDKEETPGKGDVPTTKTASTELIRNDQTSKKKEIRDISIQNHPPRTSRAICTSFPPVLSLLRKLFGTNAHMDGSNLVSVLKGMKRADLIKMVGPLDAPFLLEKKSGSSTSRASSDGLNLEFVYRSIHYTLGQITLELWTDPRLLCLPSTLLHPVVQSLGEIIQCLEVVTKQSASSSSTSDDRGTTSSSLLLAREELEWASSRSGRRTNRGDDENDDDEEEAEAVAVPERRFEASDEAINTIVEMGFSRDQALEALETIRSNRVEIAIEYITAHPPPSPASAERRRTARERRLAEQQEQQQQREQASSTSASASQQNEETRRPASSTAEGEGGQSNTSPTGEAVASSTPATTANNNDDSAAGDMAADKSDDNSQKKKETGASKEEAIDAEAKKGDDTERKQIPPKDKNEVWQENSISNLIKCLQSLRSSVSDVTMEIVQDGGTGVKRIHSNAFVVDRRLCSPASQHTSQRLERSCLMDGTKKESDPEAESVTLVACNFLLELCGRYPSERTSIVEGLLGRIDSLFVRNDKDDVCGILTGREADLARLCHAVVILIRALPRTKPLVLKHGLLHSLIQLLRLELYPQRTKKSSSSKKVAATAQHHHKASFLDSRGPTTRTLLWLSPVLLLLDSMAQPTAVKLVAEEVLADGSTTAKDSPSLAGKKESSKPRGMLAKGEFTIVAKQQKEQEALLMRTAHSICTAINERTNSTTSAAHKSDKSANKKTNKVEKTHSAGFKEKTATDATEFPSKEKEESADGDDDNKNSNKAALLNIPSFMPLMPMEHAESSMMICLRILKLRPKSHSGSSSTSKASSMSLYPPNVIHAALLLLARVLRTYSIASKCLKMGGAETVLELPSNCRFKGNKDLVTVILRHLLEDELTLCLAMETEMRSAITRLHKQQTRGSSSSTSTTDRPKIKARQFVQATTPLICRDPLCFLRAAASSVRVDLVEGSSTSTRQQSESSGYVILLTNAERAQYMKALSTVFGNSTSAATTPGGTSTTGVTFLGTPAAINTAQTPDAKTSSSKHNKGHTTSSKAKQHPQQPPRRLSQGDPSSSSPRKSKKDKGGGGKSSTTPGSNSHQQSTHVESSTQSQSCPSNIVTCLVLNQVIKVTETCKKMGDTKKGGDHAAALLERTGFLRLVDLIDILADLVLAVPACATAVLKYKPQTSTSSSSKAARKGLAELSHTLEGCPAPPATAVNFVLHQILPQPRSPRLAPSVGASSPREKMDKKEEAGERRKFYMQVRLAQSCARLIVALCARPGEGRRRVVTDLAIALSGNKKRTSPISNTAIGILNKKRKEQQTTTDQEMWALQSWADLCLGLCAPKSSGSLINSDNSNNNSALSWEVVKLMLQNGVGEALVLALQRVNLNHKGASTTAGALLRPIEVFTRGSVIDTVTEMMKTEKAAIEKKVEMKDTRKLPITDELNSAAAAVNTANSEGINLAQQPPLPAPPPPREGDYADETMLEEGFEFDHETAARASAARDARARLRQLGEQLAEGYFDGHLDDDDDDDEELEDNDDESSSSEGESSEEDDEIEVHMEGIDDEDDSNDEESDDSDEEDEENENMVADSDMESVEDSDSAIDRGTVNHSEEEDESTSDEDEDSEDDDDEDMDEQESDLESGNFDPDGWGGDEEDGDFFRDDDDDLQQGNGNNNNDDENDIMEAGLTVVDGDTDDGWQRIDTRGGGGGDILVSGGAGGLGDMRHFGIHDAAEALLHNIVRGTDMRPEAIQDLEEQLGITLMGGGDSSSRGRSAPRWALPRLFGLGGFGGDRLSSTNAPSGGAVDSTDNGSGSSRSQLRPSDQGSIGIFPTVRQSHTLETSSSASWGSRRWTETSVMDAVFGDLVGESRRRQEIADEEEQEDASNNNNDDDDLNVPERFSVDLFPGGPATATHTRSGQQLHTLLCNITLRPVNEFVAPSSRIYRTSRSVVERTCSSGANATRSSSAGRGSYGNAVVVGSGSGTIQTIRLRQDANGMLYTERDGGVRGHSRSLLASTSDSRWTEDGQPLDNTTDDFTSAFEQALGAAIAQDLQPPPSSSSAESEATTSAAAPAESTTASGNNDEAAASNPAAAEMEAAENATTDEIAAAVSESGAAPRSSSNDNEAVVMPQGESNADGAVERADEGNTADEQYNTGTSNRETPSDAMEVEESSPNDNNGVPETATAAGMEENPGRQTPPVREADEATLQEENEHLRRSPAASDGEVVADSFASGLHLEEHNTSMTMEDDTASPPTQDEPATLMDATATGRQEGDSAGEVAVSSPAAEGSAVAAASDATDSAAAIAAAVAAAVATTIGEGQAHQSNEAVQTGGSVEQHQQHQEGTASSSTNAVASSTGTGLTCPPGMDEEVFHSLPLDMQQEIVQQHEGEVASSTQQVAEHLDAESTLDPEALAALPEDLRREVIQQEQRERELRQQQEQQQQNAEAPADPANAQDMDNASFVASLSPDLRREILMSVDDSFLQTLPPDIIAEAQILRERSSAARHHHRHGTGMLDPPAPSRSSSGGAAMSGTGSGGSSRRRHLDRTPTGRIKVEKDRNLFKVVAVAAEAKKDEEKEDIDMDVETKAGEDTKVLSPPAAEVPLLNKVITTRTIETLMELLYLVSPLQPTNKLLQRLFQNLCCDATVRQVLLTTFVALLNGNKKLARSSVKMIDAVSLKASARVEEDTKMPALPEGGSDDDDDNAEKRRFPPTSLLGLPPDISDLPLQNQEIVLRNNANNNHNGLRPQRDTLHVTAPACISAGLPTTSMGGGSNETKDCGRGDGNGKAAPALVARRMLETLFLLSKNSPRVSVDALKPSSCPHPTSSRNDKDGTVAVVSSSATLPDKISSSTSCLDQLLDLINLITYSSSSTNLEQLLTLIEMNVSVMHHLPMNHDKPVPELTAKEKETAASSQKEYIQVPRPIVSKERLRHLCSVLRLESCKTDTCFHKVTTIARRLSRVEENRNVILLELASVSRGLASSAIDELQFLYVQLQEAAKAQREEEEQQLLATTSLPAASSEQVSMNASTNRDSASMSAAAGGANSHEPSATAFKVSTIPASAVTLPVNSSEQKLFRVLQTLYSLCSDSSERENLNVQPNVKRDLVLLLRSTELESLWEQLSSCLRVVSVLEGVSKEEDEEQDNDGGNDNESNSGVQQQDDENVETKGRKLQSSIAGLLTRFLPIIEAFFLVNASSLSVFSSDDTATDGATAAATAMSTEDDGDTKPSADGATKKPPATEHDVAAGTSDISHRARRAVNIEDSSGTGTSSGGVKDFSHIFDGNRLVNFVASNKALLNALLRSNPSLLDKGLKDMVSIRQCRPFMDFDVKRHWFKSQVRRLRNRRHGSLRLNIRRRHVFEDAYHQLSPRTAEEMRGRLQITFRNEEGVDAGGLSREFFEILAREIFNPNYALFTATEDGCTFQPNPNSSINPDHLRYFRFVGRIVGKAVVDGFLLDAHFTRSLYKHMLGIEPTHHDMQAIDPDYFKNLQMILDYNLVDLGLDLTFSYENHCFGRSKTIDLIPNGRTIPVTEQTKEKYVRLVCQQRMTTSIEQQISAFLEGLYELVKPELISVFTAKELELLISGMPDIDMHDLQANTEYHHYKSSDPQIVWFWNIMHSLTRSQKASFLQFVTGSSKVPLEGFSQLQGMRGTQKFSIHRVGGSTEKLVSAHTCFNALDLPVYQSEEDMKQKLLLAITEAADSGFLFA